MVNVWVKSKKAKQQSANLPYGRLTPHKILELSNSLELMKDHVSEEFSRKPRGLVNIDRWKATEFRQLLLYTGPVVLRDVLEKDTYYHFLVLHVAIRILVD